MMDQNEFLKDLDAFVDGELDPERHAEMECVIAEDDHYRSMHALKVGLKQRLKNAADATAPAVPGHLRAKINMALDKESEREAAAWNPLKWLTKRPMQLAAFGAAAVVLLIAYVQFFSGRPDSVAPDQDFSFNKIAFLAVERYVGHEVHPVLEGSEPYLTNFSQTGLPKRPAPSLTEMDYERRGCCFGLKVDNRPVAHYVYENEQGGKLSLLMWKGTSAKEKIGGQRIEQDGEPYFQTDRDGNPVILWQNGDLYYSVFGDKTSKEDLLKAASAVRTQLV
jgi:anti-sigma factor RsiW